MSERRTEIVVKELSDCGVAISGGTSGIGLATAEAFVSAGVRRMALFGRNEARGAAAIAQLREIAPNAAIHFIQADCMSVESADAAVREAEGQLEGIDVLVNSTASNVVPELLARIPSDQIGDQLLGQALAPMLMTRLVLPLMTGRNSGVIVNVSSDAAKTPTPGESTIGAAAAAIKMFTQTVALEAKRFGVRVNAITPSLVSGTAGTERITAGHGFSAKLFAKVATMADLGVPDPHDQAQLVVFLASPQAARLTGQAISLNGGVSAA